MTAPWTPSTTPTSTSPHRGREERQQIERAIKSGKEPRGTPAHEEAHHRDSAPLERHIVAMPFRPPLQTAGGTWQVTTIARPPPLPLNDFAEWGMVADTSNGIGSARAWPDVSDRPRRTQSIVRGSLRAPASYTRHRRRDRRPYGRDLRRSDAQDLHRPARTTTATSARLLISFRKPGRSAAAGRATAASAGTNEYADAHDQDLPPGE
jgi:hypothetical protein